MKRTLITALWIGSSALLHAQTNPIPTSPNNSNGIVTNEYIRQEIKGAQMPGWTKNQPRGLRSSRWSREFNLYPNEAALMDVPAQGAAWHLPLYPILQKSEINSAYAALEENAKRFNLADFDQTIHRLTFTIGLDNSELFTDLTRTLHDDLRRERSLDASSPTQTLIPRVSGIPFSTVQVCYAKMGNGSIQVLDINPPQAFFRTGPTIHLSPRSKLKVSLLGTLSELKDFVGDAESRIHIQLLAGAFSSKWNVVRVALQDFSQEEFSQNLKGDDRMVNKISITTSASGGGGGINLGPISFGGGASDSFTTTSVDVQRWVTREHALSVINGYVTRTDTLISRQFPESQRSEASLRTLAQEMMSRLQNKTGEEILRFKEIRDNMLMYVTQQNREVSVEVGMIDGVAIDSSNKLKLDTERDTAVEGGAGPIAGKAKETHKLKLDIDGASKFSGVSAPIIPTNVQLIQVSQALLDIFASDSFGDIEYSDSTVVFDSSAILVDDASIDSEVGMIIASAVPYDQCSEAFRENWVPCDGREVTGSSYARLRLRSLGDSTGWKLPAVPEIRQGKPNGEPDPLGEILQTEAPAKIERIADRIFVPDLRGQFLRGLNHSADPEVGPRNDGRQAPSTEATERIFGDYQGDELKAHAHRLGDENPVRGGASGGKVDFNDYAKLSGKLGSFDTLKTGGDETRPRNVAVHYYIKVN